MTVPVRLDGALRRNNSVPELLLLVFLPEHDPRPEIVSNITNIKQIIIPIILYFDFILYQLPTPIIRFVSCLSILFIGDFTIIPLNGTMLQDKYVCWFEFPCVKRNGFMVDSLLSPR